MSKHPAQLLIRKIQATESDQAVALVESFPPSSGFVWDALRLCSELNQAEAYGLWENQQLLALVVFRRLPDAYEISLLGTHPKHRGRGLMRRLLGHIIALGHEDWWLEVHEQNQAALQLYRALGFQPTGRRSNYYSDGGAAVLMSLIRKVF
jgi:ribosomal-protein-alanine N-acetyltransferase